MRIPKELSKVTPISRALAMFLFVILPFIGFLFGIRYQQLIDQADEYAHALPLLIQQHALRTQDYISYTNSAYKYSFLYPKSYKPLSGNGNNQIVETAPSVLLDAYANSVNMTKPPFYVVVVTPSAALKAIYNDEWFVNNMQQYMNFGALNSQNNPLRGSFTKKSDVTIDGTSTAVYENPNHEKRVILEKNNYIYVLGGFDTQSTNQFEEILATFHLL